MKIQFSNCTAKDKRKAMILVLVLWLVVLLTAFAVTLAWDVTINSKLALAQREQQVAHNLARSGVALAMVHVANDLIIEDRENRGQPYDAYSDVWAQPPEQKDLEKGGMKLGKGTFTYTLIDEEGKININKATPMLLVAMLQFYGYDEVESEDIANAIVDWRDADSVVLGDDESTGLTENEYYSEAAGQKLKRDPSDGDLIYRCPNEPFLTIEELLDVTGITQDLFFGANADEEAKTAIVQRDRAAKGKSTSSGGKRRSIKGNQRPLNEIITVYGDGNLNFNTASEEVLTILLFAGNNLTDEQSARSIANNIIKYRGDEFNRKSLRPDDALKSMADMSKISGLKEADLAALSNVSSLGLNITFKSNTFTVIGTGTVAQEKRINQTEKSVKVIFSKKLDTYNPDDARLTTNKSKSISSRTRRSTKTDDEDNLVRIPGIRILQWIE